ncbi:CBS domain-containing protein (plasmid) [Paracoccus yeei]|uniref:CBS domain-containing protein n=2 Tax=Paracoccus yeei TaxID=147645 RepID=A0A386UUE2_9RHOB|nr:CBS domain-containing protein [Paracoccus yeei]
MSKGQGMDGRSLLRGLGPAIAPGRPVEALRAALGAALGLGVSGFFMLAGRLDPVLGLYLIAPFGASSVLLFAVPNSPLAQPWSALVGNGAAAAAGVLACMVIPDPLARVAVSVGGAIALTIMLRAVHPPAGAVAMTAALNPEPIEKLGFGFVLAPVLTGTLILVGMAMIYARLTGRHYPLRQFDEPGPAGTADHPAPERLGLAREELEEILRNYRQSLNLGVEDLARLIGAAEMQAAGHRADPMPAEAFMSRDLVTVAPETPLAEVAELFRAHGFTSIPVVEEGDKYLGIIFQIDLIRLAARPGPGLRARLLSQPEALSAGQVMRRDIPHAAPESTIGALLPLLSGPGAHAVPILNRGRIRGIVTQTDLIAALARQLLRHRAAPPA